MRKITTFLAIALAAVMVTSCVSMVDAQTRHKVRKMEYNSKYNYEVATLAVGVDGTKLVKVWGYGKKAEDAIRHAKELGVACALFHGFPAGSNGSAAPTPAIIKSAAEPEAHQDYFDNFFAPGGQYLQYVNLSDNGPSSDRVKDKTTKMYKVGVVMSIAYDELRKEMERQGIAKGLNSGF